MLPWRWLAITGILLLAGWFHFFRLAQEGYGNLYYAAAVKSMLTSWPNFFFVSFDPGGFVSVDKPPLGLWIQAASAALFGFNGFSLLLPQALAGVIAVGLLYYLVAPVFGPTAGLLAALILTLTPITVAANRNNTMDSLLVLTLLLGAWAISRAVETGHWRWLFLCTILLGLGFNIKMLQAFLVLPAFYGLYGLAAPTAWWKRIFHLALAALVLLLICLVWPLAVDLTPAQRRPFVGSSQNNSVLQLIVGHNGLARLWSGGPSPQLGPGVSPGQPPLNGMLPGQPAPLPSPNGQPGQLPPPLAQSQPGQPGQMPPPPPNQAGGPNQPGGPAHETGQPGLFRLFNQQLAGQISWLLPLAGLSLFAMFWQRPRLSSSQSQAVLLWALWLLPQLLFFSIAGLFHRYYLEMLAPAVAALVGAGMVSMWRQYREPGGRGWLLPLALLVTTAGQLYILHSFPAWSRWLSPVVAILTVLAVISLVALRIVGYVGRSKLGQTALIAYLAPSLVSVGVVALLISPAVWAVTPVLSGGDTGLPFAGPDLLSRARPGAAKVDASLGQDQLLAYLRTQRQGEKFLAATLNANSAAPLILASGEPVMAMGGFSGGDRILNTDELAALVANETVRFFLVPAGSPQGPGRPANQANQALLSWIAGHCTAAPTELWHGSGLGTNHPANTGPGGPVTLFDCAGAN
jgi:4-amino-4-deoxy-L-arabinose transferase-like glycosyltransferase